MSFNNGWIGLKILRHSSGSYKLLWTILKSPLYSLHYIAESYNSCPERRAGSFLLPRIECQTVPLQVCGKGTSKIPLDLFSEPDVHATEFFAHSGAGQKRIRAMMS